MCLCAAAMFPAVFEPFSCVVLQVPACLLIFPHLHRIDWHRFHSVSIRLNVNRMRSLHTVILTLSLCFVCNVASSWMRTLSLSVYPYGKDQSKSTVCDKNIKLTAWAGYFLQSGSLLFSSRCNNFLIWNLMKCEDFLLLLFKISLK